MHDSDPDYLFTNILIETANQYKGDKASLLLTLLKDSTSKLADCMK